MTSKHNHTWAEYVYQWLMESYKSENSNVPPNPNRWIKLVEIIQFLWETWYIPTEIGWTLLVLIPKINMDTWGIGLIEIVWKVVEAVINTRIKSIVQFHNVLHVFCSGKGTGPLIWSLN